MYVVSVFEHSLSLELALIELEGKGIEKENILAIPLDSINQGKRFFDSMHGSDGMSMFDLAAAMATIGMILGVTYGFVLAGGPVIWGLIGSLIGFGVGFTIDFYHSKGKQKIRRAQNSPEVVLIIDCDDANSDLIKRILYDNLAIGAAVVN
jgi:hypothetical protein